MRSRLALVVGLLFVVTGTASGGAGWYLLIPPVLKKGETVYVARSEPLSRWEQAGAFGSVQQCEAARAKETSAAWRETLTAGRERELTDVEKAGFQAQRDGRCVASDDPRLK